MCRLLSIVSLLVCGLVIAVFGDLSLSSLPSLGVSDATELLSLPMFFLGKIKSAKSLKVMTLNIGHGRGESAHRVVQGTDRTIENLTAVRNVINGQSPDIVSLQEVDHDSFWSGGFNHAEFLASSSSFDQTLHGIHVDRFNLSYGTALLSNLDLENQQSITFRQKVPTLPKGFVIATIRWPEAPHTEVDVVSVHFDVFHSTIRNRQANDLIATLKNRQRPVVISGDFNTEWHKKNSTLKHLSDALNLRAYRPDCGGLETYPLLNKRLDWILISEHLEFKSYCVLDQPVSDHLSVVAELGLQSH